MKKMLIMFAVAMLAGACAQNEAVIKDAGTGSGLAAADRKQDSQAQQRAAEASRANAPQNRVEPASAASASSAQSSSLQQAALQNIYFGFDSYVLSSESRNVLQSDFKALAGSPSIQIEGHCDERGSSEYNLALGEKRATAAQNYLVTLGYPASKVKIISYGKEKPAAQGHDEDAWAKNRRAEFKLVK